MGSELEISIRDAVSMGKGENETAALERSLLVCRMLIGDLNKGNDYSQFRIGDNMSLEHPLEQIVEDLPTQVAAHVILSQPTDSYSVNGMLHPDTRVLVCKRSAKSSWGLGTWSVPMGKIEPSDYQKGISWRRAIFNAAERETAEEVVIDPTHGYKWIAGSFTDSKTDTQIHVAVKDVKQNLTGNDRLVVELPDDLEHTKVGWVRLSNIPKLEPMEPGTKVLFKQVLKGIYIKGRENLLNAATFDGRELE